MAGQTIDLRVKLDANQPNRELRTLDGRIDRVGDRAKRTGRELRTFEGVLGGVGKMAGRVVASFAALFSIYGVQRFTRASVAAFMEQEDAISSLAAALDAIGQGGVENLRRLADEASRLQSQTRFGDESILSSSAVVAQFAPTLDIAGLESAQTAVIALATAMDTDLDSAARLLGKSLSSSTNALSRYSIELDLSKDAAGRLEQVNDQLSTSFEVAKARAETTAGRIEQLKNAGGDLLEVFGFLILEVSDMSSSAGTLREQLEQAQRSLVASGQAWIAWGKVGIDALQLVGSGALLVLRTLHNLGQSGFRVVQAGWRALRGDFEGAGESLAAIGGDFGDIQSQFDAFGQRATDLGTSFAEAEMATGSIADDLLRAGENAGAGGLGGGLDSAAASAAELEKALNSEITLLLKAVDLGLAGADQFARMTELAEEQREVLRDQTAELEAQVVAKERLLRLQGGANAFAAGRMPGPAPQLLEVDFQLVDMQAELQRSIELLETLTPQAGELGESWKGAGEDAAEGLGALDIADQVARSVASLVGQIDAIPPAAQDAIRGLSDIIGGLRGIQGGGVLGTITGIGGVIGGVVGIVDSIVGGAAEHQARLDAAREDYERSLDAFVDELVDRDRFEQLEKKAADSAAELFRKLQASLGGEITGELAALLDAGDIEGFVAQVRTLLDSLADAPGIFGDIGAKIREAWGSEATQILDAYLAHLEKIEEQRQAEIASMTESFEIRKLLALGMDEEAAAMQREIDLQRDLAAALGDTGLENLIREVYALEEAALAAAEAAAEAAEEQRKAAAGADFQSELDRVIIQNTGDEEALFLFDLNRDLEKKRTYAQDLFDEGIITQEQLDAWLAAWARFGELAIEDYTEAIRESEEAARAAAEAERFRAMIDTENLRVQVLRLQGLDDEARELQQSIELLEAIEAGRSAEHIRLLQQKHDLEDRADMLREESEAVQETTRSIENMIGVLNGPAGFRLGSLLYDFQGPAGGSVSGLMSGASGGSSRPVSPSSPFTSGPVVQNRVAAQASGGGGDVSVHFGERSIQVNVAAPVGGQISQSDADRIGRQIFDAAKAEAKSLRARGDYEPFAVTGP